MLGRHSAEETAEIEAILNKQSRIRLVPPRRLTHRARIRLPAPSTADLRRS